ncbi:hypothetical protein OG555_05375 [Kribbella sp. NBC_01484]|uniref:RHS repeat-associated core domain-containing protein n=1 Tax=Kribbella sp. NBC_01484 TaxID=2903579 RepID=UPI002E317DD9|nr:RHS repeat-associated core domain-containing protein [Kribbella sp. NBC_01484]
MDRDKDVSSSIVIETENVNGVTPGKIGRGTFEVTYDGAATYALPLWVPPGRLGIQPELAVHYHSRGGNGLLGVGWYLSGIPQIRRSRKTIADDGFEAPVRFDSSDPFTLDGERLVLVNGTHGVDGAEYRTKRDTFMKIILHDVDSAPDGRILGPTWFEAFHKDGRILTFGGIGSGDLGSRFEGIAQEFDPVPMPRPIPDRTVPLTGQRWAESVVISNRMVRDAWGLQSMRDRSGNMLIVYYEGYPFRPGAPPAARDFIPNRIEYTGSSGDRTPALRSVDFVWEERSDREMKFVSGLRVTQNKRLKEVRMSGPDPTTTDPSNVSLLRRYAFAYRNDSVSGRSLLVSVQELDGFGVAKGAHRFDWELGQRTFHEIPTGISDIKTTPAGRSPLPGRIRVADFDGDGRDDILYVPRSDLNHFHIIRSDPSSPTGFTAPYNTRIPVPAADSQDGRVYVYPDPAGDFMNIFVLDDSAQPGTIGSPTYRVYHAGIDRSGASGSIGSFWVFPGRPIFNGDSVEGPIQVVDLDGDGLPDLLHGDTDAGGPEPVWHMRANLGGNLNFDDEYQPLGVFASDFLTANLDGGTATSLLINDAGRFGGDPRYSELSVTRRGTNVTTAVTLGTLWRDQDYVFGDFTRVGLSSAFSLSSNGATSDPILTENTGGGFGPPVPFVLALEQPPSNFLPALRVFDWNQDGHATVLARTRTVAELNDPMFVLRWEGSGFSQVQLPFTSSWDQRVPEQFDVFEVMDYDGNGLDDVVMASDGQLRVFVREGSKADMLTSVVDGLGARIAITYAPISDPSVHTPEFGYVYPQRAIAGKVWVVKEHSDDDGIGGVNTYVFTYRGGIEDVTGLGFLGFHARDVLHLETGVTAHTTYFPEFVGWGGIYPLLGLPMSEETHIPLANGVERVTTMHTTYATRPGLGKVPFFSFPLSIVEENVENANGVPTMPVRRRTITQDMDAYGNVTTFSEVWSDGNKHTSTSRYANNPTSWLIGLLTMITEQSSTPNGMTQTRKRAYQYDTRGLLWREIIEPGPLEPRPLGTTGYAPLGPQPDGVQTLYRSIDRYPNGNFYRIVEEETNASTGMKRSRTIIYDDLEQLFPVEVDNLLGHRVRATYHPGLGVIATLEDPNGVRRVRQYDGFGRFRHEASPDGDDVTADYVEADGTTRVTITRASGAQVQTDYDLLGRVVRETVNARDDGAATVREIRYDGLGRVAQSSRSHFIGAPPVFDTFSYDTLSRPTGWVGPDGSTRSAEYRGEWVIRTDANKNPTAVRVDDLDRVIFSTDRDAALVASATGPQGTAYEHGPFDTVVSVTDIAGHRTVARSDRLGRMIDLKDPDRGHRTFEFNVFGDLTQSTAGTQITTYHYDDIGRPSLIHDTVDGDVQYTWDTAANGIGKIAQVEAPVSAKKTYSYDTAGRLVGKTWDIAGNGYTVGYGYDSVGRLASISYPKVGSARPFVLGYEYGRFGQLLRAADTGPGGNVFWNYVNMDAAGLFGEALLGNQLREVWNEDPARPGVMKSILTLDSHDNTIRALAYAFDANLNLRTREDQVLKTKETFECDPLNRLNRWTWKRGVRSRGVRWEYDDIGNILKRAVDVGPGADLVYTYDPSVAGPHAVISTTRGAYTYDVCGNQTGAPGRTVSFGRGDLPTQVRQSGKKRPGTIDFMYDGELDRVRTVDSITQITSDTVDGLYEYRRPTGKPGPDGEHIFFIWINGRAIACRIWMIVRGSLKADQVEYLHADHQGSIDLITDSKGRIVERRKYDPFGRRVDPTDSAKPAPSLRGDPHTGFTGHDHIDDGWDLIDMKGRFYDPVVGKFLTPDPYTPRPLNPQSWNRYAYVLNNPLTLRDPTGFDDLDGDDGVDINRTDDTSVSKSPGPRYSDTKGNPKYESWVFGHRSGTAGVGGREQNAAPGITSLKGSLADTKCADAHTIGRTDGLGQTPPEKNGGNENGFGDPGQVGPPPNAGIAQSHANNSAQIYLNLTARLDRDRARGYMDKAPFANPTRNVAYGFITASLGLGYGLMSFGPLLEFVGVGAMGAEAVEATAAGQAPRIILSRITPSWGSCAEAYKRVLHILLNHAEGLAPAGRSYFLLGTNVLRLLELAEEELPLLQKNDRIATIVKAPFIIGFDATTRTPVGGPAPTQWYTVITEMSGCLYNIFPGLPGKSNF